MSTTKTTGTCGACFRGIALDKHDKIARHGWSEQGARKVGEYGNVWHTGPCFGAGHLPYEVSPDCTKAFLAEVLFPMALRLSIRLERLATNPDLLFEGRNRSTDWRAPESDGRYDVLLRHGDGETQNWYFSAAVGSAVPDYYSKVPSYATYHDKVVADVQRDFNAVRSDSLFCIDKVETWAPAAAAVVEKKVPLVHALRANPNTRLHRSECGRAAVSLYGAQILRSTKNAAEVTCPKCIEAMQKTAADSV